jgi:hypothetical protein
VKRASRLAQVREVVAKRIASEAPPSPAANKEPQLETKSEPANDNKEAPPAKEPKEPETPAETASKAKAWADVMAREQRAREERDAAKREREQIAREREQFNAERKAAAEAAELLAKDPVAYAAKFGGKDFGKRLVDHSLNEKAREAEQQKSEIAEVKARLEKFEEEKRNHEIQQKLEGYIGEHKTYWKTDKEASVLNSWYSEEEVGQVVQSIAERHATATREVLTPEKLARSLTYELKQRLERLAKTEQGLELLRQYSGTQPAPAKARPSAEAPKTLSKDLTTQGTPPGDGRLRKLSDKERSDMIRRVVSQRQG